MIKPVLKHQPWSDMDEEEGIKKAAISLTELRKQSEEALKYKMAKNIATPETFISNGKQYYKCSTCPYCRTEVSEPDPYGSMFFQSEEWRTNQMCSLTGHIVVGYDAYSCPYNKIAPKT